MRGNEACGLHDQHTGIAIPETRGQPVVFVAIQFSIIGKWTSSVQCLSTSRSTVFETNPLSISNQKSIGHRAMEDFVNSSEGKIALH